MGYHLKDPAWRRRQALNQYIRSKGGTRWAARSKKRHLNLLRIYRRYRQPAECRKITRDMRYLDRRWGLGQTRNICGIRI